MFVMASMAAVQHSVVIEVGVVYNEQFCWRVEVSILIFLSDLNIRRTTTSFSQRTAANTF